MTDKPDQLEYECGEWLSDWDIDFKDIVQLDEFKKSLATFVQQKVDAERKRCVEVVAEDVMQREGRKWKRWSDSPDPNVLTSHDYYTRLLSVEANTEEGEK
jgi:hypothetical protein